MRKSAGLVLPSCNSEAMTLHLDEISLAVAPGAHALVLFDQAGWHVSKKLPVPGNITLIPCLFRLCAPVRQARRPACRSATEGNNGAGPLNLELREKIYKRCSVRDNAPPPPVTLPSRNRMLN